MGKYLLASLAWISFFVLSWLLLLGYTSNPWLTTGFLIVFLLIGLVASLYEKKEENK